MPKYRITGTRDGKPKMFELKANDREQALVIAMKNRVEVQQCSMVERDVKLPFTHEKNADNGGGSDALTYKANRLAKVCDIVTSVARIFQGLLVLGGIFSTVNVLAAAMPIELKAALFVYQLAGLIGGVFFIEVSLIGVSFVRQMTLMVDQIRLKKA